MKSKLTVRLNEGTYIHAHAAVIPAHAPVWHQHQSSWLPEFVAEFVLVHIRLD
jgi:hypothetical protein